MTKQTARKWTFKGTSASLAVVMAFGMTPAATTMAMAAEGQSTPIVREISAEDTAGATAVETGAAGILSAAAAYPYEDGYAYGMSASVVSPDGNSAVSYYETEAFASVGDDMARFLGALHRAEDASVDSIVYDGTAYKWMESVGLKGSNWVKQDTTEDQIAQAKKEGKLSDYTLVGAIAKKTSAGTGAETESQALLPASLSLELKKGDESYSVSLGADLGGASVAVSKAAASSTVVLNKDWALDAAVSIDKDLRIDGGGNVISGQANDAGVCFVISAGSFAISNATLAGFGNEAGTVTGAGVFKVPDTAESNAVEVFAEGVTVKDFNRAAFDIRQGSFEIKDSTIECDNGQEKALTKGIVAGYAANSVVDGKVSNVTIKGADSTYEGWSASGIEVSAGATVDIRDVKIDSVKGGISVARNYGTGEAKVTVGGSETSVKSGDFALRVYDGSTGTQGNADATASLTVDGGSYEGDVRIGVGSGFETTGKSSISIKSGSFKGIAEGSLEDFKAFVASGSVLSGNAEEGFTVSEEQSGGNNGGGNGDNGGGSTVPGDGETVTNPDGSTTTTVTGEDGSKVETTVSADKAVTTVVEKDAAGNVTSVEATVAGESAPAGTVALPMAPVAAPASSSEAVAISVKAPAGTKVSVPVAAAEGAEEPAPGCVLVMVDAEGNETAMPKTGATGSGLALEVPGDCELKVVDLSADFPDVSEGDWFAGVADFASARNILTGVVLPDGTSEFQGGLGTTRAMFVTMLNRMELEPEASEGAPSFGDVEEGSWYAGTSAWAAEEGLLSGYSQPDGTTAFGGEDAVTREQIAVFLMRYAEWLGLDTSARAESAAPDASEVSEWAAEAVSWATAEGYILGDGGTGAVRPADGATRAEAAAIVMRFVNSLY